MYEALERLHSALASEEVLHQLAAVLLEDTAFARRLGMKHARGILAETALGVGGTIDDARDLGPP